eukprot:TRINITY_DN7213_c0_g1_i1.p1 TRINITY_DN7213_c0_g1~~TRINITY_DN7213_c0_g1_i1.p1  ORF type:complete len:142 (+),score=36.05 TRINITY_DN7213_c0_g1_i1:70-495(+)
MINMDDAIKNNERGCKSSRLLLQIHDELVYEVKEENVKQMQYLLKEKMESAHDLKKIPLKVTMKIGTTLGAMSEVIFKPEEPKDEQDKRKIETTLGAMSEVIFKPEEPKDEQSPDDHDLRDLLKEISDVSSASGNESDFDD